ncbi:uncharacterized protein LOC119691138 isoform X1 [Plutella xylostella]|uniref:uncharacterized protein LOC119691138 isoform X1 n=1 Tax=Plutella xylostella TaxID=51655 RepID=UPI002032888F|nr:uncharacterized protein LOC119691138 isoform X1 [Plutella xylostella]XP_048477884.1 uncharacterized protein LOC119691138 isoform X1 [Plutella xylostella]
MGQQCSPRARSGSPSAAVARALALLLVICLVQCAAEQRINNRGSQSSKLVGNANGWRSQRGGSCLSYGHSCWGAHGKRSGKPPASAPDWYLTRLLRKMAANGDLEGTKPEENGDTNAIFRVDAAGDTVVNNRLNEDSSNEILGSKRNPEGIPMVDDDVLSKAKLWQMIRAASEEN